MLTEKVEFLEDVKNDTGTPRCHIPTKIGKSQLSSQFSKEQVHFWEFFGMTPQRKMSHSCENSHKILEKSQKILRGQLASRSTSHDITYLTCRPHPAAPDATLL